MLTDNTWASPLHHKVLEHGADLSIQSGTKYIGGHSDTLLGTVSANADALPRLKDTVYGMGLCVGPDDMNLALRGLRTLAVRLAHHQESGLTLARWLERRPEVLKVLHPALPSHPGHAIWKRDYTGACGLFAMVLKPVPEKAVLAFLNSLSLFGMGVVVGRLRKPRHSRRCDRHPHRHDLGAGRPGGALSRQASRTSSDLIADLERGFAALAAAL